MLHTESILPSDDKQNAIKTPEELYHLELLIAIITARMKQLSPEKRLEIGCIILSIFHPEELSQAVLRLLQSTDKINISSESSPDTPEILLDSFFVIEDLEKPHGFPTYFISKYGISFDSCTRELTFGNKTISIEPSPAKLLILLLKNFGKVVQVTSLKEALCQNSDKTPLQLSNNLIEASIRKVRIALEKLADCYLKHDPESKIYSNHILYIKTIRNTGYSLQEISITEFEKMRSHSQSNELKRQKTRKKIKSEYNITINANPKISTL